MRTVDADRLKKSFEANTPIAFQDCVPGIHAIIDLEPTVEAIPVDWLLQQGKTAYASDTVEYIREAEHYNKTITDLIDKWRSEREEE